MAFAQIEEGHTERKQGEKQIEKKRESLVGWVIQQQHHHAASIDVWEGSKNELRGRGLCRVLLCVVVDPIHFSHTWTIHRGICVLLACHAWRMDDACC